MIFVSYPTVGRLITLRWQMRTVLRVSGKTNEEFPSYDAAQNGK